MIGQVLNEAKKTINLPNFCKTELGFTDDFTRGREGPWIALKSPAGAKIVCRRADDGTWLWSPQNERKWATIVQLLQACGLTLSEVAERLKGGAISSAFKEAAPPPRVASPPSEEALAAAVRAYPKVSPSVSYLTQRGIKNEVADLFKVRRDRYRVFFPLYDFGEGSPKMRTFLEMSTCDGSPPKRFCKGSRGGAVSVMTHRGAPQSDEILAVILESPLDALSFFQYWEGALKTLNIALLSTCGTPVRKMDLLLKIKFLKVTKTRISMDWDDTGKRFAERLLSEVGGSIVRRPDRFKNCKDWNEILCRKKTDF